MADTPPLTKLLNAWRAGDEAACAAVVPHIYEELKALAASQFRKLGAANATLEPTALLHEAWMKLGDSQDHINDRRHFFALAALTMRGILVDRARAADSLKRGGAWQQVSLSFSDQQLAAQPEEILIVDQALAQLKKVDTRSAEVIELHYFGGLERAAIASLLDLSLRTVDRSLTLGRAWLARALK
jgi:RNA polymerase sigma factor (TIGR02999 family)